MPLTPGRPASRLRQEGGWSLALLGCVVTLAAVLRWPSLTGGSYWFDEWVTKRLVELPPVTMLKTIPGSEGTPPFYYVLAWGWARLFGTSEPALRSLSAL